MTDTGPRSLKAAASRAASALFLVMGLISLTGLPGQAVAQTSPAPAASTPMPQGFADEVEIRIAELHRALRIAPGQEALFNAYADVMRGNAQATYALFLQRAHATDFRAPALLRWYAQLTAAHAEAVNKLIAPLDALYQSLSPEQKQAADRHFEQLTARRMPGSGH
jgi:periplasmic protein CpxP/Spy